MAEDGAMPQVGLSDERPSSTMSSELSRQDADAAFSRNLIEQLEASVNTDGRYIARVAVPPDYSSVVVAEALEHLQLKYPHMVIDMVAMRISGPGGRPQLVFKF